MLEKKNTFGRISKQKMRASAVSVLMSFILASTPVYSDEMQMEEYVDYDSSDNSYDYSYEDYSYDDSGYDESDSSDSGYDDSGSDDSGGSDSGESEESGSSDETDQSGDSSDETANESKNNEGNQENQESRENNEQDTMSTTSVDESENTVSQNPANEEMTMTTSGTNAENSANAATNSDAYVESSMDVSYEKGGQVATSESENKGNANAIDLTGDPITDIVNILTTELNELKEAIIKTVDMITLTDEDAAEKDNSTTSETENQGETSDASEITDNVIDIENPAEQHTEESNEQNSENTESENQIDINDEEEKEVVEPDVEIGETQIASDNISEPQNPDSTENENTGEPSPEEQNETSDDQNETPEDISGDQEQKDDATESLPEKEQENEQNSEPTENENESEEKEQTDDQKVNPVVTEDESDKESPQEPEKQPDEKEQEQNEIIELIGEEQQIIDLTGQDQEVVNLVQAIEEGQKPYSEVELVTNMVTDIIDLAEEIGSVEVSSGYSYSSNYGGGYSAPYMNTFNPQVHQQTREEWISSLTPYERMLTGMTKTEERPATVSSDVNIYSGRGIANTVVGVLPTGGVCYILEDGEWAYIESGEVRGFVRASDLSEGNIANNINVLPRAESMIDPNFNDAFNYLNITTSQIPEMPSNTPKKEITTDSISRNEVVSYAMQTDSIMYSPSGFVKDVYAHFGISLPDSTNDQSYVGERIDAENVRPGDLVFYKENGAINDVLICIGDGKVIRLGTNGKQVEDIDYNQVCWATRLIPGATQASEFSEIGQMAAAGNETARNEIIAALADASEDEWNTYGFPRSVLIAEAIMESNWLSFADADNGGMQPEDNNIMNMNEHLRNDEWESPWTGDMIQRNIPRYENGEVIYGNEMMRAYNDIESCFNDYAAFKTDQHPNIEGETDIDIIIEEGLQGYATDPDYQASIKRIIEQYDLTQFDNLIIAGAGNYTDSTNYTQEQLELIWAITAQEDDKSYEGALAVISTAMNRADSNYGGHGTDALSQLTADGQFCYSPSVSNPIYYQRRLGGNVPEYVKQAVYDCLEKGVRNHSYLNFRSSNRTGNYIQIGGNWFF